MTAIHHTVINVRDMEASLRFYRDGIGLDVLRDTVVDGDWPTLFGAPSRTLRVAFLGDASAPDVTDGVLELAHFDGDLPAGTPSVPPSTGMAMVSYFVDVTATLARLDGLGFGGAPRQVTQVTPNGAVTIALVLDPDGVAVLLTPGSITQS